LLECGVDVLGGDGFPAGVKGVAVVENAGVDWAVVAENVVDPTGQGFDGAIDGASAFLMDALAFDSIFLVWDSDSSLRSGEKGG
jgi:hypothetical protein